jgi:hypothetical protein
MISGAHRIMVGKLFQVERDQFQRDDLRLVRISLRRARRSIFELVGAGKENPLRHMNERADESVHRPPRLRFRQFVAGWSTAAGFFC